MLQPVAAEPRMQRRVALAGAFAATALMSAAVGALGAARLARWAGRLAPDEPGVRESLADHAPRVVVPLVKPGCDTHQQHARQHQATSGYDVGDTMHQRKGAVKA